MEKSPIVEIAKRVCPAVITIVISKDLPKIEGYYIFPFGGRQFVIPQIEKRGKEKTKIGGGSGFVVSPDGYVITCNHVVKDSTADYTVILEPTKKYPAKVLAKDPLIDVAILKIEGKDFPCLEIGNSSKIELGETVVAIGNPLGEFEDTLSSGIVSGLSRKITAYGGLSFRATSLRGLIQTDAAINPGNSGGPLVNMEGKAIGINTAMVMGAQNIGFAIPINYAKRNLEEVIKYGKIKKPFLGVRYFLLNKEIAKVNKLPVDYGALIVRESLGEKAIVKESPADRVGLKEYDIILECNGKKINEENPLADILQKHKIGEKVSLKILREEKKINVKVQLEEKK
ncbi:MAG: trypsin-like peptidase domain-containing protein [Candidatus Nealsonbacteria bacterium]|nr:MAG: trypsin-like peptidase domain-containing protein [Candidatus Nealsonbacteria bacterium]